MTQEKVTVTYFVLLQWFEYFGDITCKHLEAKRLIESRLSSKEVSIFKIMILSLVDAGW